MKKLCEKNCAAYFSGPFHYCFEKKIAEANLLMEKNPKTGSIWCLILKSMSFVFSILR